MAGGDIQIARFLWVSMAVGQKVFSCIDFLGRCRLEESIEFEGKR
jgi:hypothetical protein